MKTIVAALLLFISVIGYGQVFRCPLNEGEIIVSLKKENYGVNELGTTIVSTKSGKVKSFIAGKIFNILKDEHTKTYIVIIKDGQNYISFNGLDSVSVKKDDIIKEGEKIGSIKPFKGKYTLIIMKFINTELVTKPFENDLKCRSATSNM